ncbi:MAG: hypothetical protein IJU79_04310 [Desulfovibrionaceae bacterium]|nr:hypothetical protein [Desulfovibrionaceae bacterium]
MAFASIAPMAGVWMSQGLKYLLIPTKMPQAPAQATHKIQPRQTWKRPKEPAAPAPQVTLAASKRLPVNEWPESWQALLQKVQVGTLIWTYPELGLDLLKEPSQGVDTRRNFFGQLLRSKPMLPKGTHTFWPYMLPNLEPNPVLFWSGVRALGGKMVVALGREAGRILLAESICYKPQHIEGVLAFMLPDIATLTKDADVFEKLLRFVSFQLDLVVRKKTY